MSSIMEESEEISSMNFASLPEVGKYTQMWTLAGLFGGLKMMGRKDVVETG